MGKWVLPLTVLAAGVAYLPGVIDGAAALRWSAVAAGVAAMTWTMPLLESAPRILLFGSAYAALSLAWAPDPMVGVDHAIHLALFVAAVAAGAASADRDVDAAYLAAGAACAAALPWVAAEVRVGERAVGLFSNRDTLAQFSALAAAGAACLSSRWAAGAAASAAACLGATRSWGGAVACVAGLVAGRAPWDRAALVLCVAAATAAASATQVPTAVADSVLGFVADSMISRMGIWRPALGGLSIAGSGEGGFSASFPAPEHAHNDALHMAYELGLGALPFVAAAVAALLVALRRGGASAAVLVAFLTEGLVGSPLLMPATALLGGVAAGSLLGRRGVVRRILRLGGVGDGPGPHEPRCPCGDTYTCVAAHYGGVALPVQCKIARRLRGN